MSERWNLIVVVPAHNEADRIDACIRSVLRSVEFAAAQVHRARVVVVADKCTDETAAIARAAIGAYSICEVALRADVLEIDRGNVGMARALGVAYAQKKIRVADQLRTWVANTDADTCVPEAWIAEQLRWAAQGVAAVAGVVVVDSFADHAPIVADRFHATYTALLPDDSLDHMHVHGANIGVRLDAYLDAGGWQQLELSEDHDLWNRLRAYGHRTRSPSSLHVITSGRSVSRCPGGFADSLCAHNKSHDEAFGDARSEARGDAGSDPRRDARRDRLSA